MLADPRLCGGFIDGEGCFCVSVHPHPNTRHPTRWLVAPCFQAYQHRDNVEILEALQRFFGCGRISAKGPNSSVMTYSVYRRQDLESVIIPFFERYPLVSRKHLDFLKFSEVVRLMQNKAHQTEEGFQRIIELAFSMNQHGKQRRYRKEEVLRGTLRDCTPSAGPHEPVKIQSDPHGDMGRAAEMTASPAATHRGGRR
jgi:LAGLIDADG DNA endonuclease family protein